MLDVVLSHALPNVPFPPVRTAVPSTGFAQILSGVHVRHDEAHRHGDRLPIHGRVCRRPRDWLPLRPGKHGTVITMESAVEVNLVEVSAPQDRALGSARVCCGR